MLSKGWDTPVNQLQAQCIPSRLALARLQEIRLEGKNIFLVPFSERHLTPEYVCWFNDPEATRYTRHGAETYTLEKAAEYFKSVRDSKTTLVFAVHSASDKRHAGNVSLSEISWPNRSAEIAIMVGDPASRGKGLGEASVKLVLDFAFSKLHLHRIKMGMTLTNQAMNKIAEKLGFQREGIFKDALFKNGTYHDIVQWAKINSK